MNRIDGKVTKLEKNFSRMKAAQNNNKSKYEDTWIKEAVEAAMDIRVLLHIEMRASGKPNAEIEKRIYNCFLKYGDTGGKSPAADTSKPKPATPATSDPKPSTGAGGAKAKICDAAKKTTKECEDAAAEEAREKKRREREERERAEEAAKEAARKKREAEQKRIEEEKRKQREAEEKREREEEERRKKEE